MFTMHELVASSLSVFLGFFAIMNPIANTPVFLGLVGQADRATQKAVAIRALLIAFVVIASFSLLGKAIFELFGIGLPAFRIAGGVLVALVGYHMLSGENSKVSHPSDIDQSHAREADLNIAISPLAVPILAGPGTIATAVNFGASASLLQSILVALIFGVLCVLSYGFFMAGERILRVIGQNGIKVITRLMGMILTVIGVQLLIDGIKGAFAL